MLCMVGGFVWLWKLKHILNSAKETRGHGDGVRQENAESVMDGEKDKHRSDADGGYLQEVGHHNRTETTVVSGPYTEREQLREWLPACHNRKNKSEG